MAELQFIENLKQMLRGRGMSFDFEDDAALLPLPHDGNGIVVTTDMIASGVHFDATVTPMELIGRKALAVNLSDLAACGARPEFFFLSLLLPRQRQPGDRDRLMAGMLELAAEFQVNLAGGDTNFWDHGLVINIAVIGTPHRNGYPHRNQARPGDAIIVTGDLGDTLSGHHLTFRPRTRESMILLDLYRINAMADISDGLATDLRHILNASGVGALLEQDAIPVRPSLAGQGLSREQAAQRALTDGEDFELVLTMPQAECESLLKATPKALSHLRLTRVGTVTTGREFLLRDEAGSVRTMDWRGFQHG